MHHFSPVVASTNILDVGPNVNSRTIHNDYDLSLCRGGRTNPYTSSSLDECSFASKVPVYGLFCPNPNLHGVVFMQLLACEIRLLGTQLPYYT